ncbi:MAG TPA: cupin [Aestuariivirga sp.]|nr:cupin [Aestuariivirga sp.]
MPTEALSFVDDGDVPNHPRWPLIVYSRAIAPETLDTSEYLFDELFARNGWPVGWRNGIYPFTHYHSKTREVLGIAKGEATVQFGGKSGKILTARAGDALLLPAGTGHKRISSSPDLLVIGAYPPGSMYDLMRSGESDKAAIRARIAKVAKPDSDPVSGAAGAMLNLWT